MSEISIKVSRDDNLLQGMERLERALDASPRGAKWAEQVESALGDVERLMLQQRAEWCTSKSPYQAVDETRPTLARKLAGLRLAFATTLVRAISLREKFERVTANLLDAATTGRSSSSAFPFERTRTQGRALLEALRHYQEEETKLVLESNLTDLGAGD